MNAVTARGLVVGIEACDTAVRWPINQVVDAVDEFILPPEDVEAAGFESGLAKNGFCSGFVGSFIALAAGGLKTETCLPIPEEL